jgi:hypothetical protein
MNRDSRFRAGPSLDQATPVDIDRRRSIQRRDGSYTITYQGDDGVVLVGSIIEVPDDDWPPSPGDISDPPPPLALSPQPPPLTPPIRPLASPKSDETGSVALS